MGPPPYPGPVQVCSLGITPPDLFKFVHLGTTAQPSYPYHMGNQPRHFLPTYTGISHLSPSSRSARGQKFGLDFTIYTSTKRFSLEITNRNTVSTSIIYVCGAFNSFQMEAFCLFSSQKVVTKLHDTVCSKVCLHLFSILKMLHKTYFTFQVFSSFAGCLIPSQIYGPLVLNTLSTYTGTSHVRCLPSLVLHLTLAYTPYSTGHFAKH